VGDHLGVGLRGEDVAVLLEGGAELVMVLDDPVVHDRDPPGAVGMGVRVAVGRGAVRRPARVPDRGRPRRCRVRLEERLERRELAGALAHNELLIRDDGDPGRVVAPVLQAPEAVEHDRERLVGSDVADDPAHAGRA
jgi:hypothetical protein